MILLESAETAEAQSRYLKDKGLWHSRWRYERGANHLHADMGAVDREHVRQELEIAERFAAALRRSYPNRAFVITHIPCYAVSFYQAEEDAPTEGILPLNEEKQNGAVWCQTCERNQSYTLLPSPDALFPMAEWGRCEVCHDDVITYYGEILTLLSAVE